MEEVQTTYLAFIIYVLKIVQVPIIFFLIILSFSIKKRIKIQEFLFIGLGWCFNLAYMLSDIFSETHSFATIIGEYLNSILTNIKDRIPWSSNVVYFDLVSSFMFLMVGYTYLSKSFLRKIFKFISFPTYWIITIFILAGLIKFIPFPILDSLNKYVVLRNIPITILDFISLVSLAYFFNYLIHKYNLPKFLFHSCVVYAFIQFLSLPGPDVISIFIKNSDAHLFGYGIGLLSKFIMVGSLISLLTTGQQYLNKNTLYHNIDIIFGRTIHEITPQLLHIDKLILDIKENKDTLGLLYNKKMFDKIVEVENALTHLKTIYNASKTMYINDIFPFSEETKDIEISKGWENENDISSVNEIIYASLMSFKGRILNEHITNNFVVNNFKVKLEFGKDCNIYCNYVELVQVFYNLFLNSFEACQFTSHKCYVFVKTKTILNPSLNEESRKLVCIEFEDNGPGIPEQVQKEIFHQGFSTKLAKKIKIKGYGLHIIKSIVDKYNGNIRVESPVNSPRIESNNIGTKFILSFPKQIL